MSVNRATLVIASVTGLVAKKDGWRKDKELTLSLPVIFP
jgi:hypothetical protein